MKFNKKKRDEELRGLHVVVHNGDFTKALRKFKKKVADDGLLQELRKREYYESKGTKRRKEKEPLFDVIKGYVQKRQSSDNTSLCIRM